GTATRRPAAAAAAPVAARPPAGTSAGRPCHQPRTPRAPRSRHLVLQFALPRTWQPRHSGPEAATPHPTAVRRAGPSCWPHVKPAHPPPRGDTDEPDRRRLPVDPQRATRRRPRAVRPDRVDDEGARARRLLRHPDPQRPGLGGTCRTRVPDRDELGPAGGRPEPLEPPRPPRALLGLPHPPAAGRAREHA